MSNYGYHWTPCNRGGGGGWIIGLAVAVVAAVAAWRVAVGIGDAMVRLGHSIEHTADVGRHVCWEGIEAAMVAAVVAVAALIATGVVVAARRAVSRRQEAALEAARVAAVPAAARPAIGAKQALIGYVLNEPASGGRAARPRRARPPGLTSRP